MMYQCTQIDNTPKIFYSFNQGKQFWIYVQSKGYRVTEQGVSLEFQTIYGSSVDSEKRTHVGKKISVALFGQKIASQDVSESLFEVLGLKENTTMIEL